MRGFTGKLLPAALVLILAGCATMQEPVLNKQASAYPPALKNWCQDVPVHFFLVNGMNNYPFGQFPSGLPDYVGCNDYRDLYTKLGTSDSSISEKWMVVDDKKVKWMDALHEKAIGAQFADFVSNLISSLNKYTTPAFDYQEDTSFRDSPANFCIVRTPAGYPLGFYFVRKFDDKAKHGKTIYFHGLDWAIDASNEKETCYGRWIGSGAGTPVPGDYGEFDPSLAKLRDPFNKLLKFEVTDWGLGDAALYLNPRRSYFQWCVATGFFKMLDGSGAGDRFMIRSHSLGSTIVMDTLTNCWQHRGSPELKLAGKTTWADAHDATERRKEADQFNGLLNPCDDSYSARLAFYMYANQYALLTLGRPPKKDQEGKEVPDDSMREASQAILQNYRHVGYVQLVAFTDPDDVLSFPMRVQDYPFKISNVYLSNNKWKIPAFGTWPPTAHTNYDKNLQVSRIVCEGIPNGTYPILH